MAGVVVAAWELVPQLNSYLGLVALPNDHARYQLPNPNPKPKPNPNPSPNPNPNPNPNPTPNPNPNLNQAGVDGVRACIRPWVAVQGLEMPTAMHAHAAIAVPWLP